MKYKLYYQYGASLEKVKSNTKIKGSYGNITEAQRAMDLAWNTKVCDVLLIRQTIEPSGSKRTTNIASIKPSNCGVWVNFLIKDDIL